MSKKNNNKNRNENGNENEDEESEEEFNEADYTNEEKITKKSIEVARKKEILKRKIESKKNSKKALTKSSDRMCF